MPPFSENELSNRSTLNSKSPGADLAEFSSALKSNAVASPETFHLVELDRDHPGFRDAEYRQRRNAIAQLALDYKAGTPIPDAPYTADEHALWRSVTDALDGAHEKFAAADYLACKRSMALPHDRIPQLAEVSARVEDLSGFRLAPVAGLVAASEFLASLARGVFLSTQYIRHHSAPFYTPEPDVVHEVAGHAVALASPRLAALNRLFGNAARRIVSEQDVERLTRVYWYTIEFGVVRENEMVKTYGAGLLSSVGEMAAMRQAQLLPFDIETMERTPFDPTDFQPVLFCAEDYAEMCARLKVYLRNF